jgi:type I restriction enzyme M protein
MYGNLTEVDVKALLLHDKWQATVTTRVSSELDSLTLALVGRIRQLGERYLKTVGDIDAELAKLRSKVAGHLADMGVE